MLTFHFTWPSHRILLDESVWPFEDYALFTWLRSVHCLYQILVLFATWHYLQVLLSSFSLPQALHFSSEQTCIAFVTFLCHLHAQIFCLGKTGSLRWVDPFWFSVQTCEACCWVVLGVHLGFFVTCWAYQPLGSRSDFLTSGYDCLSLISLCCPFATFEAGK